MAYDEVLEYQSQQRFAAVIPDCVSIAIEVSSNPRHDPRYRRNVNLALTLTKPSETLDAVCANPSCRFGQVDLRAVCHQAKATPPFSAPTETVTRHVVDREVACGGWEHAPGLGGQRVAPCDNILAVSGVVTFRAVAD